MPWPIRSRRSPPSSSPPSELGAGDQPAAPAGRRPGGLAAGAGLAIGGAGGFGLARTVEPGGPQSEVEAFYGVHQAGIATAAQERIQFAAFDVLTADRAELVDLLKTWTAAAIAMTSGQPIGDPISQPLSPPVDGLFAVPPGIAPGGYIGQTLFG
jgi:deferrochelatase/peroxidase EfeB